MSSHAEAFEELNIGKTRGRADTIKLLACDPATGPFVKAPSPEATAAAYTKERLQESLLFAHQQLARRTITPRSEAFLFLYKEDVKQAIMTKSGKERQDIAAIILEKEKQLELQNFLRPLVSREQVELQERMLQLKQYQYLARYGDYMRIIPAKLRLDAKTQKPEGYLLLAGVQYWTDIEDSMQAEAEAVNKSYLTKTTLADIKRPVTNLVHMTCKALGIDKDNARWAIKEYALRNLTFYNDLDRMKKQGHFSQLAQMLCADRNDLESTFSCIRSETDLNQLRDIIEREIKSCFEFTDKEPNNPGSWSASPSLRQYRQDAIDKCEAGSKLERNLQLNAKRSAEKLVSQHQKSIDGASSKDKKRVASTEVPRGSEEDRRTRKDAHRFNLMAREETLIGKVTSLAREVASGQAELDRVRRELKMLE